MEGQQLLDPHSLQHSSGTSVHKEASSCADLKGKDNPGIPLSLGAGKQCGRFISAECLDFTGNRDGHQHFPRS